MKRAAAIVLSLMIIWLQALASVQASSGGVTPKRSCCSCGKSCCVSPTEPNSQPLPLAPVSVGAPTDFSTLVAAVLAWTLPSSAPSQISSSDSAPLPALAVPLFTRHCALLI